MKIMEVSICVRGSYKSCRICPMRLFRLLSYPDASSVGSVGFHAHINTYESQWRRSFDYFRDMKYKSNKTASYSCPKTIGT